MTTCRNQLLCSLILSVPSFLASFGLMWTSYTIPILESDETPLTHKITAEQGRFIGSFPMLGSFLITLFVGFLSDGIGRKNSEILCGLLLTLSWAIITTAKAATQLLIGRFIFGTGFGIQFAVALIFTSEMAHPSTTGSATSMLMFGYSIGTLCSYLAGWFCSYEVICYINLTMSVIFVVAISFMKETPAFLIGKGKEKEALRSLRFYRAASTPSADILEEYNYIKSQRINKGDNAKLEKSQIETEKKKLNEGNDHVEEKEISAWKILLTSKSSQREVVSISVILMLTVFMGMVGVQAYAGRFFSMAVPNMSPHLCSVVLALVLAVSSGVATCVTDRFSRRVLLLSSMFCTSCAMALLATQLRWSWAPNWVTPLLVVLICVAFQMGANHIPLVQANELFIPEIRGLGMQILMLCVCTSNFLVLYLFRPSVEHLGLDWTFFMLSLMGTIGAIVVFFIMRETKGVPHEIIQEMFANGYLYRKIK